MAAPHDRIETLEERRAALADHLRAAAAEWIDRAPGISQVLTTLARQCDRDPVAVWSPRLDEIILVAATPRADLSGYTTLDLDAACVRVKAQAEVESDFHAMMALSRVQWTLHNAVARRTGSGIIAPRSAVEYGGFGTRQDDLNARRRHKRSGRWS